MKRDLVYRRTARPPANCRTHVLPKHGTLTRAPHFLGQEADLATGKAGPGRGRARRGFPADTKSKRRPCPGPRGRGAGANHPASELEIEQKRWPESRVKPCSTISQETAGENILDPPNGPRTGTGAQVTRKGEGGDPPKSRSGAKSSAPLASVKPCTGRKRNERLRPDSRR